MDENNNHRHLETGYGIMAPMMHNIPWQKRITHPRTMTKEHGQRSNNSLSSNNWNSITIRRPHTSLRRNYRILNWTKQHLDAYLATVEVICKQNVEPG
jgi:hypothetical protein